MPVLNEAKIIEAKLQHSLQIGRVVVVEGSIPQTRDVAENGLSSDGTTEILKSYSDKITYIPAGHCKDRMELQNRALVEVHKRFPDTEILHRTDADEFIDLNNLQIVEQTFNRGPFWLVYTDLVNLIDMTKARKNVAPNSRLFPFAPGITLKAGMFHERFYRYRPDLSYTGSAHCLCDHANRPLYIHPDYYFNRSLIMPKVKVLEDDKEKEIPFRILHYKFVDGSKRLIKAEMSYLEEDENLLPNSQECFDKAVMRLKSIFEGDNIVIPESEHCKEILKYFKYEPLKMDWNLTLNDVI
jgi:hypothetical protein